MLDDCEMENGPMMVIPGSHHGPIFVHRDDVPLGFVYVSCRMRGLRLQPLDGLDRERTGQPLMAAFKDDHAMRAG